MTIDDTMLMAFADGELDPITQKRIERAIAADPSLADRAATFGRLTEQVRGAFAPIADAPVPAQLSALLAGKIVAIAPKPAARHWLTGLAVAASLLLGLSIGSQLGGQAPLALRDNRVVASGSLAKVLDTQLASAAGDVRVLVSFRGRGGYCRVFASAPIDGIACRSGGAWELRQSRSGSAAAATDYRQAGSADAALMADAQNMMQGAPLDAAGEARARASGWK